MTCAPASISSDTGRPSRAPSTTKSVISAMASGWLSLTPRSRRLRATMAAMAISSLSFSLGVRVMSLPVPEVPEPRQGARSGQSDKGGDDEPTELQPAFGHGADDETLANGADGH